MKLCLLFLIAPLLVHSQQLSKQHYERIDHSVVKIMVNDTVVGTGFFISQEGHIATAQHIIAKAIKIDKLGIIQSFGPIRVKFSNGETIKVKHHDSLKLSNSLRFDAEAFDFYLLKTAEKPKTKIIPFSLGKWKDVAEGDVIYTAGFPLNTKRRIVTLGRLSTKYNEERSATIPQKRNFISNHAYLDLTLNTGNSGGPIIKWNKNTKKELVIGIATHAVQPLNETTSHIMKLLNEYEKSNGSSDREKIFKHLFTGMLMDSYGIGIATSIDYLNQFIESVELELE